MEHTTTAVPHGTGVIGGLTGLMKNLFSLLLARVELAAVELSEVRNHAMQLLTVFALAVVSILFALAYGSAVIVALAWESMGWTILLVMFLVVLAAAAALVFKGRAMLKENKLAFPETMSELKHDRDMLL